jgi:hypothetical protein
MTPGYSKLLIKELLKMAILEKLKQGHVGAHDSRTSEGNELSAKRHATQGLLLIL